MKYTILELIGMKYVFDLKLSETFSGKLSYEKTDYLSEEIVGGKIYYDLYFKDGKIDSVSMFYEVYGKHGEEIGQMKWVSPEKWNHGFWKKAPKYVNCDDCRWVRSNIKYIKHPNIYVDCYQTKMVV